MRIIIMNSRLTRNAEYYSQAKYDKDKHIMPFNENVEDQFAINSFNERDIESTLIKITEDDKYVIINYFNAKGIINKFKTKKKVQK